MRFEVVLFEKFFKLMTTVIKIPWGDHLVKSLTKELIQEK